MTRVRPKTVDLALAVALAVGVVLQDLSSPIWMMILDAAGALMLIWRRTHALWIAAAIGVLSAALIFVPDKPLPQDEVPLAGVAVLLIAAYSIGAYERRLGAAIAGGAVLTIGANFDLVVGLVYDDFWPFRIFFFVGSWSAGRVLHGRHRELDSAQERALRLELEQDLTAERAVYAERARLARELHDVIAHNVSLMVVQASAAEQVLEENPKGVRDALANIQAAGRQTVTELRRLLGILRDGDRELLTMPQPTLAQIDVLVDQVRAAGLDVEVVIEGSPQTLPASVDLSGFRIVQEALTNTLKHSRGRHAEVHVVYTGDELQITVTDDGVGATGNGSVAGHGLAGVRERVSLFGGTFEAHAREEGGFILRAVLPVGEVHR